MNQTAIFWPMLAHVLLVYVVYYWVSKRRIDAVRAGSARSSQFRENQDEPPESLFARNNLANQFELPVLFYPLCLALYVTEGVTLFTVAMAWLFTVSRYVHAWIHTTTNRIRFRRPVFIVGFAIQGILWITFAMHIVNVV